MASGKPKLIYFDMKVRPCLGLGLYVSPCVYSMPHTART